MSYWSNKLFELVIPVTKLWDEVKVKSSFKEEDARFILAIKIPQILPSDRVA